MRCSTLVIIAGGGVPAVTFQVELAFEGVVDRFDDLAQRFEELRAGPSWLAVAARAQQVQPGLGQGSLEVAAVVVLVADQRLAGQQGGQLGVAEDGQQYLPLVGLGAGQREPDGSPCRVHNRCSRSPQNQREREAQYLYWAYPARSERRTVSADRPHSTCGVPEVGVGCR